MENRKQRKLKKDHGGAILNGSRSPTACWRFPRGQNRQPQSGWGNSGLREDGVNRPVFLPGVDLSPATFLVVELGTIRSM